MSEASDSAARGLPRFAKDRPLPPYAYVSGSFPHPTSSPEGHSHGVEAAAPSPVDEARWRDSPDYLHAVDLFNYGFYWEAHEAWERLWIACGRRGAMADFLKALIKLAAAGVKLREGRARGVRSHAARCVELLTSVAEARGGWSRTMAGLRLDALAAAARALEKLDANAWQADAPRLERRLPIALWPGYEESVRCDES
jgi:hypothetical protein